MRQQDESPKYEQCYIQISLQPTPTFPTSMTLFRCHNTPPGLAGGLFLKRRSYSGVCSLQESLQGRDQFRVGMSVRRARTSDVAGDS